MFPFEFRRSQTSIPVCVFALSLREAYDSDVFSKFQFRGSLAPNQHLGHGCFGRGAAAGAC